MALLHATRQLPNAECTMYGTNVELLYIGTPSDVQFAGELLHGSALFCIRSCGHLLRVVYRRLRGGGLEVVKRTKSAEMAEVAGSVGPPG